MHTHLGFLTDQLIYAVGPLAAFLIFVFGTPIAFFLVMAWADRSSRRDNETSIADYIAPDHDEGNPQRATVTPEKLSFEKRLDAHGKTRDHLDAEYTRLHDTQRAEYITRAKKATRTPRPGPDTAEQHTSILADFTAVQLAYTAVETNPETLLDMPAILDVTYPATAAFHAALADATRAVDGLREHGSAACTSGELAAARHAVDAADTAWQTARTRALAVGIPGVSARDRDRAHKLLTLILDESAADGERENAKNALDQLIADSGLSPAATKAVTVKVTDALAIAGASAKQLTTPHHR